MIPFLFFYFMMYTRIENDNEATLVHFSLSLSPSLFLNVYTISRMAFSMNKRSY